MMKDDETPENSIDELITYPDDDTLEDDDFSLGTDAEDAAAETVSEYDESDYREDVSDEVFEIDEDYDTEPYTDDDDDYTDSGHDEEADDEYFDSLDDNDDDAAPSNERKRIIRIGIIGAILIAITCVVAFFSMNTELLEKYKSNFVRNASNVFSVFGSSSANNPEGQGEGQRSGYNTSIRGSVVVSPDGIRNSSITPYKDGVICASANHLYYIDSSGNTVWEENTLITEPLLSVQGSYILIAEKNRNKLCLYNDKKLLYEADDADSIAAVSVSSSGDAVLITSKASYRGGISVYNKVGEQVYSWASGNEAVISADISSPSRKVAVALLNTESSAKSKIQLFDINQTESYSQINVEDTVVYSVKFTGNILTAFGDNRLVVLSDSGSIISNDEMNGLQLTHSAIDGEGNKLVTYYNDTVPMVRLYDRNGTADVSKSISGICDFIDIEGKTVLYNIGRDIYCGRISIDSMTKLTAGMDIKGLMLISQNSFVIVYSNSIEIVRI